MNKITYNEIKKVVTDKGFELLECDDNGSASKIVARCKNGHIKKVTFASFRLRPVCYDCLPIQNSMPKNIFLKKLKNSGSNCELIGKYDKASSYLEFKCLKCGNVYKAIGLSVLKGHGCRKCSFEKTALATRKTHEKYVEEIKAKYKDEFEILSEYKGDSANIQVKHNKCGKISCKTAGTLLRYGGCKYCKESKGEKAIEDFLKKNSIDYEKEYRNNNCRYRNTLPFDFAIFKDGNLKYLIEYDGELHYKVARWSNAIERLQLSMIKDNIKSDFAKNNKIKLIRIPYWDFDNINIILTNELKSLL